MIEEGRIDLILQPGEEKILPPRQYLLRRLSIPAGSKVTVPEGGRDWLIWDVSEDATIDGLVVYQRCSVQDGTVTAQAPNGDALSYTVPPRVPGGDGGAGGDWQGRPGGSGASGTVDFGGGGGGGAWFRKIPPPGPGVPAAGRLGGRSRDSGAVGGDGASTAATANGGFVYIRVAGRLSGNGTVDVRGQDGAVGANGARGEGGAPYGCGGGGGGGGAPGGAGGAVVIRAVDNASLLQVLTSGGKGGAGGAGGNRARSGFAGGNGSLGRVDWL
jgi:hypothetical protein